MSAASDLERTNAGMLERSERDLIRTRWALGVLLTVDVALFVWLVVDAASTVALVAACLLAPIMATAGMRHGQSRSWVSWDRYWVTRDRNEHAPRPAGFRLYPRP